MYYYQKPAARLGQYIRALSMVAFGVAYTIAIALSTNAILDIFL